LTAWLHYGTLCGRAKNATQEKLAYERRPRRMTDSSADDLSALTNVQLANLAAAEQIRYRHHLPSNDRYALELYRRGINNNHEAWRLLQEHVARERVEGWLRQHPCFFRALEQAETLDNLVHHTFTRFWQAVGPAKKEFASLAELMEYLKICVNSVVIDEGVRRTQKPPEQIPLDFPAPEADPDKHIRQQELWAIVSSLLKNDRERLLAQLLLKEHYKPREIQRLVPNEFPTTQEIFRLWRNILDRCRRSPRLRRWFEEEEP
jgi:hypothetical protein